MGLTLDSKKGQVQMAMCCALAAPMLLLAVVHPCYPLLLTDYLFACNLWHHKQLRDFQPAQLYIFFPHWSKGSKAIGKIDRHKHLKAKRPQLKLKAGIFTGYCA